MSLPPPVPGFLTGIAPVQEVGAVNFSTAPSRDHYRPLFANSLRSSLVEEAALSTPSPMSVRG